ncbi:MAG: hypothetical protein U0R49_11685 [Fimbriimonadales bacterium]
MDARVKYSDGTRSTYTYDGDGQRRSRIEPGGSLTTLINDGAYIIEERS